MQISTLLRLLVFVLLFVTAAVSIAQPLEVSTEQAERLERKIDEIDKNALAVPVRPKKTPISEPEINSYLNFNLKERIPSGLSLIMYPRAPNSRARRACWRDRCPESMA